MINVTAKPVAGAIGAISLMALATGAAVAMPPFGDWSEPVNIESLPGSSTDVNSDSIDGCASISPDGLTLAFNSFRSGNQQIYLARRKSTSEGFGAPEMLSAPVNGPAQEFCPTIMQGNRLYFSSSRDGEPGDIYVSKLGPKGWSEPERLGPAVNTAGAVEESASFYEDGDGRQVMLFSRRPPGPLVGPNGKVFQSVDGAPATLVNGGVNSSSSDNRPSVTHDGRTIFWDSQRTGSLGGPDIWYATRSSTSEAWGQAVQLSQVSTSGADTRPYVSWDGETMIISASNDMWVSSREQAAGQ
jgi:Tol biopolymer transport system component